MLTERQELILNGIIDQYVNSAKPISSKLIEKIYDFGVSPATIRNEMRDLTEMGYIIQPHTSAGRIPTDKGYRFFIDQILEEMSDCETSGPLFFPENHLELVRKVSLNLSKQCSGLAMGFFADKDIFWKEGLSLVFQEPEFGQSGYPAKFINALNLLEERFDDLSQALEKETRVYIGRENPLSKHDEFSLIISRYMVRPAHHEPENLFLAIFGPKRMNYKENIGIIKSYAPLETREDK